MRKRVVGGVAGFCCARGICHVSFWVFGFGSVILAASVFAFVELFNGVFVLFRFGVCFWFLFLVCVWEGWVVGLVGLLGFVGV